MTEIQILSLLVVIFLALSAYLAAAEIAIVSASPAKLYKQKIDGDKRAGIALRLHADREKLFGCILLLYNLATIAASTLTTSLMITLFGDSVNVITAVTLVMTMFIVIYGELMPKTYAVRSAEQLALSSARFFEICIKVLNPLLIIIQKIVNFSFWLIRSNNKHNNNISALDTIRGAIEFHHDEGHVVHEDRYMLGGVIDLHNITVEEVMIHRSDVQSISLDDNIKRIISIAAHSTHSRMPIWEGSSDNIIGIVHAKDLLKILAIKGQHINANDIKMIARDPWFIPDTTTLKSQLQQFRERKQHFACVVDEYGDLRGILTLEDILEEVVGQIDDEYDAHSDNRICLNSDGSVYVPAEITLRDLNRHMHWQIPDVGYTTVAGLLLHLAKGIPDILDEFEYAGYSLKCVQKRDNKLLVVHLQQLGESSKEELSKK